MPHSHEFARSPLASHPPAARGHGSGTAAQDNDEQSDGSLTPTASQTRLDEQANSTISSQRNSIPPPPYSSPSSAKREPAVRTLTSSSLLSDTDAASTHAPSTLAPSTFSSTVLSYAPSSVVEHTTLLPHGYTRPRYAPAQPAVPKTKGRKVFEGLCDAVNVVIPLDIDEDVTNMKQSSIGRLAKHVQDRRRSVGLGARDVHGRTSSV